MSIQKKGQISLMDIDVKGARDIFVSQLVNCNYIFVKPPSLEELKKRLEKRFQNDHEQIDRRLKDAEAANRMADEMGIFQRVFVNDDRDKFIEEATRYIIKDLYRISKDD
jgi:guanylate kinase